jgi:hypothetical protein
MQYNSRGVETAFNDGKINVESCKNRRRFLKRKEKTMKLSDQALGAVMMALQKSLLEQSDIVPVLKDFELQEQEGELVVTNPPLVNFGDLLVAEE